MKGLKELQDKLQQMAERAKKLDGAKIQVEGGITPQKQKRINKALGEHVLHGKPLKRKW